jgi:hypothetical protein
VAITAIPSGATWKALAPFRRADGRALHSRQGTDHRRAGRQGADGHRADPHHRILRFRRQIYRWPDRHVCPAEIPEDVAQACKDIALRAHQLLGCKGTSRSDFRWDDEQGVEGLFLLEVNTQPGMTPLSLVPEQARHLGMDYADLVEAIVAEALADAKAKKGA